jgi:hypothetical protein
VITDSWSSPEALESQRISLITLSLILEFKEILCKLQKQNNHIVIMSCRHNRYNEKVDEIARNSAVIWGKLRK